MRPMITKKRDLRALAAEFDNAQNSFHNPYHKKNQGIGMEHQKKRWRQDAPMPSSSKPLPKPIKQLYQTISDDWSKPNRPDDADEPPKKKQKKGKKQTVFMEIDDSDQELLEADTPEEVMS